MADIATIEANLVAALDYEETGSVTKAKQVVTYANQWLVLKPQSAGRSSSNMTMDTDQVRRIRDEARQYVNAAESTNRVSFFQTSTDFRR